MTRWITAYLCTGAAFVALDACFLTLVGPRLYRPTLDSILGDTVRPGPAVLFYLLYFLGLIVFAVLPSLGQGWRSALGRGALLGLVAYGTYDLTCQSVMRVWTWPITLADLAWGMVASAAASSVGVLAIGALGFKAPDAKVASA
jgi:uncharacterized membrane protein